MAKSSRGGARGAGEGDCVEGEETPFFFFCHLNGDRVLLSDFLLVTEGAYRDSSSSHTWSLVMQDQVRLWRKQDK